MAAISKSFCSEGFALASLAETDDRLRGCLQVTDCQLHYFFNTGDKLDPALGRGATLGGLFGDAAQTVGVAMGRDRNPRLPALVEDILGRQAVVFQGAFGQLRQDPVAGE